MEDSSKQEPSFTIGLPVVEDALAIAQAHIQSWKETYVTSESGLTNKMVDELLKHFLTDTTFREQVIMSSLENPDEVLYRVVKNDTGEVVGFLHGSKHIEYNELDAIYLLDEVKGTGTGQKLIDIFLDWVDKEKKSRLEVFSDNNRAISFYEKYGFSATDLKLEPYRGILPCIEMVRSADTPAK